MNLQHLRKPFGAAIVLASSLSDLGPGFIMGLVELRG